jgi:hypothetical protein
LTYKFPVDPSAQDKVDINEKEGIMVMLPRKIRGRRPRLFPKTAEQK